MKFSDDQPQFCCEIWVDCVKNNICDDEIIVWSKWVRGKKLGFDETAVEEGWLIRWPCVRGRLPFYQFNWEKHYSAVFYTPIISDRCSPLGYTLILQRTKGKTMSEYWF